MQVNPQEVSAEKATTPRYDTIVIRGAKGKFLPKEVDGGEVVAWSSGHELAAMDALEDFVTDLAAGNCYVPQDLTHRATLSLELMYRRRILAWDAAEHAHLLDPANWSSSVRRSAAKARDVFGATNDEANQAIEYMVSLMLVEADAVQGGDL